MPLRIVPLDPSDAVAFKAWHDCYLAAHMHGREIGSPWMLQELRAQMLADNPGWRNIGFAGLVDETVVVAGWLDVSLRDNLHIAAVEIDTHPAHRNRGHGTAMLEHLTAVAGELGRDTLVAEASYPYDGPVDGAGHPNVTFLLHRGFTLGIVDVMRVLDLPADEALLRKLADEAAGHHEHYTIHQFTGPVPEDIIDSFGALVGSLITEAPMGEMDFEPEVVDAQQIRADEKVFAESGRAKYTTVALAPDGTVAAYSELVVPAHDPGRVYQWGTLAHRDHRGHRLGLATKTRDLLWLQQERPDAKLLVTYNAEVNAHMIGVNEEMGFRPVERMGEFQKKR
jgi:GNAT superfamily N-acetyltransferase/RimJ/RimL family protein N-acetyltransferase